MKPHHSHPPQDAPLKGLSNLWAKNFSQIIISHNVNLHPNRSRNSTLFPQNSLAKKMYPKMPHKWVPGWGGGGGISCTNTRTPECLVQFGAGILLGITYKHTWMLGLRKRTRNRNLTTKQTTVDPKCLDDPLPGDVVAVPM